MRRFIHTATRVLFTKHLFPIFEPIGAGKRAIPPRRYVLNDIILMCVEKHRYGIWCKYKNPCSVTEFMIRTIMILSCYHYVLTWQKRLGSGTFMRSPDTIITCSQNAFRPVISHMAGVICLKWIKHNICTLGNE